MAYFTVTLPGNVQADIYKGKIVKKHFNPLAFLWGKKKAPERSTGYIAIVPARDGGKTEYLFTKMEQGGWATTGNEPQLSIKENGKWRPMQDDNKTTLAIKKSIDEFETNKRRV